jgi:glycosyltransferase involved in cell wall biosynthesis
MGRVNELNQFVKSFRPILKKVNEVIIIDDFSKNEESRLIKSISKRSGFRYFKNHKNIGPAKSKNYGAKLSKSENLWFLDSDVQLINKDIIANAINFLEDNPNAIFGSEVVKIKNILFYRLSKLLPSCYSYFKHIKFPKKIIKQVHFIPSCNLFIKRKNFFKISGFPDLITGEDKLFCLKAKSKNILTFYNSDVSILHLYSKKNRTNYINQIKNIINCHISIYGFAKGSSFLSYYFNLILSLPLYFFSQLNIIRKFEHRNTIRDKKHFFKILELLFFNKSLKQLLNKKISL